MDAIHEHEILTEIRDLRRLTEHLFRVVRRIEQDIIYPRLARIQIAFTAPSTLQGDNTMAVQGPVTLTTAGQVVTASINGYDQFGNPWTGAIPPVTFSIDDSTIATSVPNTDGVTDAVTAVANGVANLTASLTTVEGLALTNNGKVRGAFPPPPPPPAPVLSSIKIA